jgi:dCMP deaminase
MPKKPSVENSKRKQTAKAVLYGPNVHRLSIERYAMELAFVASRRSEDPFRQVGAVALDKNNRVIGTAYNGLAAGKKSSPSFWQDREKRRKFMFHAEQNLCSLFKRGEVTTVAVTTMPCNECSTLLASHGVKHVLYNDDYPSEAPEILKFHGLTLTQIS